MQRHIPMTALFRDRHATDEKAFRHMIESLNRNIA